MAIRPTKLSPMAFAAAFLLVVHTMLAGFAAGAHAAPFELDAFGSPLCLGELGTQGGDAPADHQSHRECCDFGCHSPAAAAPLPDRAPLFAAFPPSTLVTWRLSDSAPRTRLDRASIRLRGPPLKV